MIERLIADAPAWPEARWIAFLNPQHGVSNGSEPWQIMQGLFGNDLSRWRHEHIAVSVEDHLRKILLPCYLVSNDEDAIAVKCALNDVILRLVRVED